MAYTPPLGNGVDVEIGGAYTPPSGGNIALRIGEGVYNAEPGALEIGVAVSESSVFEGVIPAGLGVRVGVESVWVHKTRVAEAEGLAWGVVLAPVSVTFTPVFTASPDGLLLTVGLSAGEVFEGAIPDVFGVRIGLSSVDVEQIHVARGVDMAFVLALAEPVIRLKPEYELPVSVTGGMGIRFRKAPEKQAETAIRFEKSTENNRAIDTGWNAPEHVRAGSEMVWGEKALFAASRESGWEEPPWIESGVLSDFVQRITFGPHLSVPWGGSPVTCNDLSAPWLVPPEVLVHHGAAFRNVEEREIQVTAPWLIPPEVNRFHETLWGKKYYERICLRKYDPPLGDGIVFNLDHPLTLCGDGDHADFFFDPYSYDERCTQREPSGWRENPTFKPVVRVIPRPPMLGVYIVQNNAMLCRLPDRTPIEVLSISLSSKIDSWCWEFSAVFRSLSDLALVRSLDGSPVPVEAEINGWKWVIMVEDSDGARQFPKGSWNVSGRSLSAELSAPYAPVKTYTEGAERLSQQLAAAELEYTDWTFDWEIEDWIVPAGVFSVTHQTPMETILSIVRAAGGELSTHRTDKVLRAISRYPISPWNWASATPVISLHESVIITLGWRRERRPGYNGVYVSGSTVGGVNVFVKRTGTEGDAQAQMIVDPLITAVEAGRERGRVALSRAGRWSGERLSLPLMSGTDLPGLLACGDLIEVQEGGGTWRGQVSDVTVTANRQNGLKVYQNIEVERYHG
jgi:hypothetical protein